MIAMLLASLYCLYNRWVIPALSGFGLYFVGMIGFGLLEHRTRRRMPPPEAGQVRCGHCGVSVPILATEESTECPSCGSPLALSPSALAQAVTAAEQALARAERAGGRG